MQDTRTIFTPNYLPVIESTSRLIALLAPRRFGKTENALRRECTLCQSTPKRKVVYIAQYRQSAQDIAWDMLYDLDEKFQIGADFNNTQLLMKFPNRSSIKLYGADDKRFGFGRFIGQKYDKVILDEAQEFIFIDLGKLIREAIYPALGDKRGSLIMQGTPGIYQNYFWQVVFGQNSDKMTWEFIHGEPFSNPHTRVQQREQLDELRAKNPSIESEAWVRRQFFGEWVSDNRLNVVKLTPGINYIYHWEPKEGDRYILGIDFGFDDPSAYVVLCENSKAYKHLIYIEALQKGAMMLHDHIQLCKKFMERYPGLVIYADPAGHAKALIEEMRRNGVSIYAADKKDKRTHVERLNSEATVGKIKIYNTDDPGNPEESLLAKQWNDLIRVFKYGDVMSSNFVGDELSLWEEGTPRHIHDAALYARRGAADFPIDEAPESSRVEKEIQKMKDRARRSSGGSRNATRIW